MRLPFRRDPTVQLQQHVNRLCQAWSDGQFWHDHWLKTTEQECVARLEKAEREYEQGTVGTRAACERQIIEAERQYEQRIGAAEAEREAAIVATQREYEDTIVRITQDAAAITREAGMAGASWDDPIWDEWQPGSDQTIPRYVRAGTLHEGPRDALTGLVVPGGLNGMSSIAVPALLPFIDSGNILFKVAGQAKQQAIGCIQSMLLRVLATLPPAKVRFTFFDPIGLGQNMAAFMHLADYNESLVTGKAWTEPQHIEQRLVDLTEHMEMVIQKYLRNQYATIEEFNANAGEVAEPYRVLVVLDFPAAFSETAARRLFSIAQNGPRCGVYTIMLVDPELSVPEGFNLRELERMGSVIYWNRQRFVWQDEAVQSSTFVLDAPPDLTMQKEPEKTLFGRILTTVGKAAKDSSRVEVPFEKLFDLFRDQVLAHPEDYEGLLDEIDPADPASWWQGNSAPGLTALVGRAGATRVQCLTLGKGTAHHVLLTGKTGSGKSTLLHTLITSVALFYSPNEVELYLIDFKKGVEFKTYAAHALPHARVVAIESEREFGLSVLQGLDAEMKRRGELFRQAGVDDVPAYRERIAGPMPRILLLVDEFQEFFTENDAIASGAAQLLDRLVRQGRSFGIHVLLASQSLAGAFTGSYMLPRSTIDQMQVRIALQCSEADSRLILSDDNLAARSLTRPGAAIYNSNNGVVEGNNPCQVAWLSDEHRDAYLATAQALAKRQGYRPPAPQRVFEGNEPADITQSPIAELIEAPGWPGLLRATPAWLGEPIAIKDPTAALFARQSGANLLVVGQNDEGALGLLATAMLSLAAHNPPLRGNARFYVLDFTPIDWPHAGSFARMADLLPHEITVAGRRHLPEVIVEIAATVNHRIEEQASGGPVYLVIFGLQWARDLRPADEFGFGFSADPDEPPSPAKLFPTILREGPDVGVHTLAWCDTLTNLNRTLDHRMLREFVLRVVLQMSAQDSRNLVDVEAASKLGPHQALYCNEEEGRLERFRPYALPSEDWLRTAGDRLRGKVMDQVA